MRLTLSALSLSMTLGACGIAYYPQDIDSQYFNNFNYNAESIIPVSLTNINRINGDGYVPRTLPLSQNLAGAGGQPALPFPRSRLAALSGRFENTVGADVLSFASPDVPGRQSYGGGSGPSYTGATGQTYFDRSEIGRLNDLQRDLNSEDVRGDISTFQSSLPVLFSGNIGSIDALNGSGANKYLLQPGDILRIYERPTFTELSNTISPSITSSSESYTVDAFGRIYFGDDTALDVSGKTIESVNRAIADVFADLRPDVNPRVEIDTFKSQFLTFISDDESSIMEMKFQDLKLLDALGSMQVSPKNKTIYLFRDSRAYSVEGDTLLSDTARYSVTLLPGDTIYVSDPRAFAETSEFLRLKQLETDLADKANALSLNITRFLNELDQARVEDERYVFDRQVAEERWRAERQLAVDRFNTDLDQYQFSVDQFGTTLDRYNQSERVRVANERAARADRATDIARDNFLREFEYDVEVQNRAAAERIRVQAGEEQRFFNLLDRDLIPRDSLTLTGEFNKQNSVFLPLGRQMTVAEAVYQGGQGFDVTVADPRRVYLFRSYNPKHSVFDAYLIDMVTPQGLIAMQKMQVRPDDVIYIDTQPLTNFARVLQQILPLQQVGGSALSAL